jgi:hypothetical protein
MDYAKYRITFKRKRRIAKLQTVTTHFKDSKIVQHNKNKQ